MSRSVITDLLQPMQFWLFDAAPVDPLALPMLTPLFGFSSITAPQIVGEVVTITEGNWYFKRKILKGADVPNITLSRGVQFYDADFWRWMMVGLSGDLSSAKFGVPGTPINIDIGGVTPRRQLMLVQFLPRLPVALPDGSDILIQAGLTAAGGALGSQASTDFAGRAIVADAGIGLARGVIFGALQHFGPFEFVARLPAKAWMLYDVMPVRHKVGSDFDANTSAMSIQELELSVEIIEEISLVA